MKVYRIAGRSLAMDAAGEELAAFEVALPAPAVEQPRLSSADSRLLFDGPAWVVDRSRRVECRVQRGAFHIRVSGIGWFWVAPDGRTLGCACVDCEDPRWVRLALLGPALTLALAAQGVFCLHASAVRKEGGAVAFTGESGTGKSTLAAALIESAAFGDRRVSDDILAVDSLSAPPLAHRAFPQLKLASAEQPYLAAPARLPLRALFQLDGPPRRGGARGEVGVEPLGPREGVLVLLGNTVASRLFDGALLERHMDFCASVGARVPVYRLSYPWRRDALPRVAEAVSSTLNSPPALERQSDSRPPTLGSSPSMPDSGIGPPEQP